MESKTMIFRDAKEVIEKAVAELLDLGVFAAEIEIELQGYVKRAVRKEH